MEFPNLKTGRDEGVADQSQQKPLARGGEGKVLISAKEMAPGKLKKAGGRSPKGLV